MTTMELRASVFDSLNSLLDSEEALRRVDWYLRSLKEELEEVEMKAHEDAVPYTMAEINARIDESERQVCDGDVFSDEDIDAELKEKFPWLK